MNKRKVLNTIVFFSLLYGLLFYILVVNKGLIFSQLPTGNILLALAVYAPIPLAGKYLVSVFDLVLKLTGYIGNFIFGLISSVVFYLILTPISFYKKLRGQKLMEVGLDSRRDSYFEEWEAPDDISKQY